MIQKKTVQSTQYPLVNWSILKKWSVYVGIITTLLTFSTGGFNGFVNLVSARVSQSVYSDYNSLKSTIFTIRDTDIPFLRTQVSADIKEDKENQQQVENRLDAIEQRLGQVATKEDIHREFELIIPLLKNK